MAYLHCHNCGWSQDDFWEWKIKWNKIFKWTSRPFGYNPLSILLEDISVYIKPKKIKMDSFWLKENGIKGNYIHSWKMLWKFGIQRFFNVIRNMKYPTYKSFIKAHELKIARCPKCGNSKNLDID